MSEQLKDWTESKAGRSNSSELFGRIERDIAVTIRNSAFDLLAGRTGMVAGLILAQLAHKFKLGPTGQIDEDIP
jgi:hypothetical protein